MSKPKILILSFVLILLSAGSTLAQTESFKSALALVERFDIERREVVQIKDASELIAAFHKRSNSEREKVTSEIKTLIWTEGPSERRFTRLFELAGNYMDIIINEVNDLALRLPIKDKPAIERASTTLDNMRKESLKELQETKISETRREKKQKIIPIIDRSPYDEKPGDTKGIFER